MIEIVQTPDYQYYVGKPPFRLPVWGRFIFFAFVIFCICVGGYAAWTYKLNADLKVVQKMISNSTKTVEKTNDGLTAEIKALSESDHFERYWMPLASVRETASATMSEVLTTIPSDVRLESYIYEQQPTGLTDVSLHMSTSMVARNKDDVLQEAQNFLNEFGKYSKSRVAVHDTRVGPNRNQEIGGVEQRVFSTEETWSLTFEELEPKQVISLYRALDKSHPIERDKIGLRLHIGGPQ